MKTCIYAAIGLAFLMMAATIIGQYRIIKQEETKQVAIKNPAEKKAEVVERVITRTVTKEGTPIEIIKEVVKTVVEKTPVVPSSTTGSIISPNFYVCGAYGYDIVGYEDGVHSYGVGVGYNFNNHFSTGVRYDTIGREQRVAVEVRVNF